MAGGVHRQSDQGPCGCWEHCCIEALTCLLEHRARLCICQAASGHMELSLLQNAWRIHQIACGAHAGCTGWVWQGQACYSVICSLVRASWPTCFCLGLPEGCWLLTPFWAAMGVSRRRLTLPSPAQKAAPWQVGHRSPFNDCLTVQGHTHRIRQRGCRGAV